MEDERIFEDLEKIIKKVKRTLDKIQKASNNSEKDGYLYDLMAYLISSSNDVAQMGDYYEAAGRLYTAAYYLEDFHPKESKEIYLKTIEYYNKSFYRKVIQGAIYDASKLSLKISNIYRDKLKDKVQEIAYINKAIGLISNQIKILKNVGSLRDLCGRYQTLTVLNSKIENWTETINSAISTLKIAKKIKDYSIISNSYYDLINALKKTEKIERSITIFLEALDYFLKEAAIYEDKNELIILSQLYHIIKNFYYNFNNSYESKKYIKFSRKEAGIYISLAKKIYEKTGNNTQIASYYRGAGLCYKEIVENNIDSASCFFKAGNHFFKANKYSEAALNYEDAAKIFKTINKRKSYDLYIKAAKNYLKIEKYQLSLENYLTAEDICNEEKWEKKEITHLIYNFLISFAHKEESKNKYFIAAGLQIKATYYYIDFDFDFKNIKGSNVRKILNNSLQNYLNLLKSEFILDDYELTNYLNILTAFLSKILNKNILLNKNLKNLKNLNNKSKFSEDSKQLYNTYIIINKLINWIDKRDKKLDEAFFLKKFQKIFDDDCVELEELFKILKNLEILKITL